MLHLMYTTYTVKSALARNRDRNKKYSFTYLSLPIAYTYMLCLYTYLLLMWQQHVSEAAQPALAYWSQAKKRKEKGESKEDNRQ